ncbi:MAG: septum formation initiator [Sciscionella sp.]
MTAPARESSSGARSRTAPAPARERAPGTVRPTPDATPSRTRSAAAERAYARRAERAQQVRHTRGSARQGRRQTPGSLLPSRASFVVLVMGLLVSGVVAILWFSTQATAGSYQLEKAQQLVTDLTTQAEQLQEDVAKQSSPASLAAKARQLGMVPAGVPAVLVAGQGGKVTVIGTPTKATAPPPPPAGRQNTGSQGGTAARQSVQPSPQQQAAPAPGHQAGGH